jgi:hypothetical protein
MRKLFRSTVILLISLILALTSAALSGASSLPRSTRMTDHSGSAFLFQITTTPQIEEDRSEIGSTDGITVMGFVIVAIIIIPIILKRKNWAQI